jgi:hypothetical protein
MGDKHLRGRLLGLNAGGSSFAALNGPAGKYDLGIGSRQLPCGLEAQADICARDDCALACLALHLVYRPFGRHPKLLRCCLPL